MELKYWDLLEYASLYFSRCSFPMMQRRTDSISPLACAKYSQKFGYVTFFSVIVVIQRLISGVSHSDNMKLLSSVLEPAKLKDILKAFSKIFKDTVKLILYMVS